MSNSDVFSKKFLKTPQKIAHRTRCAFPISSPLITVAFLFFKHAFMKASFPKLAFSRKTLFGAFCRHSKSAVNISHVSYSNFCFLCPPSRLPYKVTNFSVEMDDSGDTVPGLYKCHQSINRLLLNTVYNYPPLSVMRVVKIKPHCLFKKVL